MGVRFVNSVDICDDCDQFLFLKCVSDVMTRMGLNFGFVGWVDCDILFKCPFTEKDTFNEVF